MRASILGFLVTILVFTGFCLPKRTSSISVQRGWPWRVYTREFAERTSIQHWHVHHLFFYALLSMGAGVGVVWLALRFPLLVSLDFARPCY